MLLPHVSLSPTPIAPVPCARQRSTRSLILSSCAWVAHPLQISRAVYDRIRLRTPLHPTWHTHTSRCISLSRKKRGLASPLPECLPTRYDYMQIHVISHAFAYETETPQKLLPPLEENALHFMPCRLSLMACCALSVGSRLTTIGSWPVRTMTHCEGMSPAFISLCGTKGGT